MHQRRKNEGITKNAKLSNKSSKVFCVLPSPLRTSHWSRSSPWLKGTSTSGPKITEMVMSGIADTAEVRWSLKYHVDNFLCEEIRQKTHPHDRMFYPLKSVLSTFDQDYLLLKVVKGQPHVVINFYFRPFGSITIETCDKQQAEQTFLYIYQEEWQKDLIWEHNHPDGCRQQSIVSHFSFCV